MNHQILCIGEVLWDSLPGGLFLGGAPFNVACHLQMLGADIAFASRIGKDELGNQILRRMTNKNIPADFLQRDPTVKTGIVNVSLLNRDNPQYEIVTPVAWDFIEETPALLQKASTVDAMVFGTLAQRNPVSRKTIESLRKKTPLCIYDVNLRPPFAIRDIVQASLLDANLVKLNDHELVQLSEWFDLSGDLQAAARQLSKTFQCDTVCVTKGASGAALLHKGEWTEHKGYAVHVRDTVGAGDAFLAALISGILAEKDNQQILEFANAVGAWVATKEGATPELNFEEIKSVWSRTK
ncbi:carbohydrate kinase [candidate division KSB1 bacterium]|nr:carbohydrate kinase [candidate division KSB1 bacterium]